MRGGGGACPWRCWRIGLPSAGATLAKIEKGDAGVSLRHYAKVLFALGLLDNLAQVADAGRDELGLSLASEDLPRRIRVPRVSS